MEERQEIYCMKPNVPLRYSLIIIFNLCITPILMGEHESRNMNLLLFFFKESADS